MNFWHAILYKHRTIVIYPEKRSTESRYPMDLLIFGTIFPANDHFQSVYVYADDHDIWIVLHFGKMNIFFPIDFFPWWSSWSEKKPLVKKISITFIQKDLISSANISQISCSVLLLLCIKGMQFKSKGKLGLVLRYNTVPHLWEEYMAFEMLNVPAITNLTIQNRLILFWQNTDFLE